MFKVVRVVIRLHKPAPGLLVTSPLLALFQEPSCLCTDLKGTEPFAAGLQELQLEQTQLCLHEANMQIEDLTLELERSARTQAEQYSKLTRQLEYTTRVYSSQNCLVHKLRVDTHCSACTLNLM